MKKLFAAFGISLLATAALPLFGEDGRAFSQVMKDIQGASAQVKKGFESGAKDDVASGGEKLHTLYKEVEVFWAKRGAADAIESTKTGIDAAKAITSEANTGSKEGAQTAFSKLNGTCKSCHEAHREKLSDGTYKIK